MNFDIRQIGSATMILFAVIDVLGALPILIEFSNRNSNIKPMNATLISGAIMVVFLFLGQSILQLIGLDIHSFALAGAIVIFFLGLEMVLGIRFNKDETGQSVTVVPIAFPLIAGTGTLTTLLSIRAEFSMENILVGIFVNLIFVYVVLKNIRFFKDLLGDSGISILRKVFGIVLLALSIKLFRTNIGAF